MLLALLTTFGIRAQYTLVATLSHDGNITTFYTSNALIEAHQAAVDGDIITLSSGSFTACDITKNVTVRGAGMILEESPTILTGRFKIQIPTSTTSEYHVTLEGMYINAVMSVCDITNLNFVKCWFNAGVSASTGYTEINNYSMFHCVVASSLRLNNSKISGTIYNSYINDPHCYNAQFINSVININGSTVPFNTCSLTNCVITDFSTSRSTALGQECPAIYCVYKGSATNFFRYQPSPTNRAYSVETEIFKDGTIYELLDEYKGSWIGNDNTQIGMYGGSWPFDPTTTNPRITKFNVAKKTTADGKLPVEIEVKAN